MFLIPFSTVHKISLAVLGKHAYIYFFLICYPAKTAFISCKALAAEQPFATVSGGRAPPFSAQLPASKQSFPRAKLFH